MKHCEVIRYKEGQTKGILFMHGILGSPRHFDEFVKLVPEDTAIYNILLDGHGGDVLDFSKTSMDKWKEQVKDVYEEMSRNLNEIHIVAHSMGTLFALQLALQHPDKVKSMILLQMPLRIGVKVEAAVNSIKMLFDLFEEGDKTGDAYKKATSIDTNTRLWEYAGWAPKYIELFRESARARRTIKDLKVKTLIFLSENDELVSIKSKEYIPNKRNIKLCIMKNSAHFMYDKNDFDVCLGAFRKMVLGDVQK